MRALWKKSSVNSEARDGVRETISTIYFYVPCKDRKLNLTLIIYLIVNINILYYCS